jgi:hypothetical protein
LSIGQHLNIINNAPHDFFKIENPLLVNLTRTRDTREKGGADNGQFPAIGQVKSRNGVARMPIVDRTASGAISELQWLWVIGDGSDKLGTIKT